VSAGAAEPAWRAALAGAGLIAGSAMQLRQPVLWAAASYAVVLFLGLLVAGVICWARWRHHGLPSGARPGRAGNAWPARFVLALATAAIGFGSTGWRAEVRLADALPPALEGQDLVITGLITGLPQTNLAGTRFVFDVDSASWRGAPVQVPRRLSLGWYRGFDVDALVVGPLVDLRAGQRWRFTVRLRQPHGHANPHGFDLELWLFEQGIRASGSVRATAATPPEKLADEAGAPVQRLRQHLRDRIEADVADPAAAGVLAALAVGDQAAIARGDWDLFRSTGVAHLMSISGLHVTMFAWLAGIAVGAAWRLSPRAMLAVPAPAAARGCGLAAAASYAVLAGWGVPAQRTVWMIATVVLLRSAAVRWPQPAVLGAAAVVVTVLDPWALLQPGFWLSFVAVGLLIGAEPVSAARAPAAGLAARLLAAARGGLRTQAVATVGLAPLTMVFFQQVSLVGFVANLVAIPLVTLLVTPLALLGTWVPGPWWLAGAGVQALMHALALLAEAPLAVWTAAAAPPWAAALGLIGAALLVLPLPRRLRALGLPMLLPLMVPAVPHPPEGSFEMVAVDVGQGTAVLVRTRSHLLVYDAGPAYSAEADAGERVLLPLLRARGEQRIDLLMLSHRDSDHVGGAAALLAHASVQALSSSLADSHPLRAGPVPHRRCDAGQSWLWDGVRFDVLHPRREDHALAARPNTLSCVLHVASAGGHSVLLSGDIEAAQEAALLARDAAGLRSSVLLVPHHGSKTSSTAAFIDAVAPQLAVVQAAYRSRFGHPAAEVVERYRQRGVPVLRSDACGAWAWRADAAPAGASAADRAADADDVDTGVCQRRAARRYWHHPGMPASGAAAERSGPMPLPKP
jgi:competence protein ComEC